MGTLHSKPVQHNSRFQIGPTYTHASLKIHDQPLFHGSLGGLQASYEYRPWNRFYGGITIDWKQGACQARDLIYFDTQERVGYTFASKTPSHFVTLFSGLGYRYLGQKFHSLQFDYNEFYLPVDLLSQFFPQRWWSIGLNLTWMPQVYPTVKISPLKGARWILEKTIGNLRAEFPFTFFLIESNSILSC